MGSLAVSTGPTVQICPNVDLPEAAAAPAQLLSLLWIAQTKPDWLTASAIESLFTAMASFTYVYR